MRYARELTCEFRMNGQSEAEIAEVLRELDAHGPLNDEAKVREFGTPSEYAQRFEKGEPGRVGRTVVVVGVVAAVVLVVGCFIVGVIQLRVLDAALPVTDWTPSPVVLGAATVLCLVSVVAGFLTDYLRPVRTKRKLGHI